MHTETIKRDGMSIEVTYSGEIERHCWGKKVDEGEIVIGLKIDYGDENSIDVMKLVPHGWRLMGPTKEAFCGNGDSEDEMVIGFEDLSQSGNLIMLLHELGHANTNERYEREIDMFQFSTHRTTESYVNRERYLTGKLERSAWGWVLSRLRGFKEKGIELEPEFASKEKLKDYIRDALLSHEVHTMAGYLDRGDYPEYEVEPHRFWNSVDPEYLKQFIDELYEKQELKEKDTPRDQLRELFKLK